MPIQNYDHDTHLIKSLLETGKQNFKKYYLDANTSWLAGGQIELNWDNFKNAISTFINETPGVSEDQLVLKFIHRYDVPTNVWFLCMCCCQKTAMSINEAGEPATINGKAIYNVVEIPNGRFTIKDNTITKEEDFLEHYDPEYFNLRYYDGTNQHLLNLDPSSPRHIQSCSFPWSEEIATCYNDNVNAPGAPITLIKFSSVSFDESGNIEYSEVQYPHGIAITFINSSGELINNNNSMTTYKYKGADFAALCPPNCNSVFI